MKNLIIILIFTVATGLGTAYGADLACATCSGSGDCHLCEGSGKTWNGTACIICNGGGKCNVCGGSGKF